MRKIYLSVIALLFMCFYSIGQTTTSIRLSSATGWDAYVSDYWTNTNLGTDPDIAAIAWSSSGTAYKGRSYFKFDLSAIPVAAVVSNARLSLYGNPNALHSPGHSTLSGSNTSFLQRVIGTWDEGLITWENQPGGTSTGHVDLAASTSQTQDYLNIDVTNLVAQMVTNPSTNYGFLLSLNTETAYRALNFASADCADTASRPKLVITYVDHTGINQYDNDNFFKVYPNPVANNVTLETQAVNGFYQLQDVSGRILMSNKIMSNISSIDISAYSSGVYFLNYFEGDKFTHRKIIKQ